MLHAKTLVRLFLYTGVPFGLLMGLFGIVNWGARPGIVSGLIAGILFGGIMTGILGYLHIRGVERNITDDADEINHHMKQHRNIELPMSYERAFELCIASLQEIEKAEVQSSDYSAGSITARTGTTWDSWGELISFRLTEAEGDGIRVELTSEPSTRQIVDYGKNLENANAIVAFLQGSGRR